MNYYHDYPSRRLGPHSTNKSRNRRHPEYHQVLRMSVTAMCLVLRTTTECATVVGHKSGIRIRYGIVIWFRMKFVLAPDILLNVQNFHTTVKTCFSEISSRIFRFFRFHIFIFPDFCRKNNVNDRKTGSFYGIFSKTSYEATLIISLRKN